MRVVYLGLMNISPSNIKKISLQLLALSQVSFETMTILKHGFLKYLNESCRFRSDEYFSINYFLDLHISGEIITKLGRLFEALKA